MTDEIMTQHPEGKQGVNISRDKYDLVREAILEAFKDGSDLTFGGLSERVETILEGRFEGSIMWYLTTIKLDLEARGEIERVNNGSPQRMRATK